jgi:hypothetical protein
MILVLAFSVTPAFAQDDSDYPQDDSIATVMGDERMDALTDSEIDTNERVLFAPGADNPIAFGVVYSNGSKQSGTANWNSTYNATYKRYEIKISGENYYYLGYATNVTPAGDIRYCRTSSVDGKLLVYCYDKNGGSAISRFGFSTFKAP